MSKRCQGCGALLQQEFADQPGYTPKADSTLCQRCFRLVHYDDLKFSMKEGIDADQILHRIAAMDALVLWVVDLFDFEASLLEGMNRHLLGKDIVLVATKRDLLPETLSPHKLGQFLLQRLDQMQIRVRALAVTGRGIEGAQQEVMRAMQLAGGRDIVVMGMANAGKSTLLNSLMSTPQLTSSRYPGTTLDFNPLTIGDFHVIDTPGLMPRNSLLLHLREEDLKTVLPSRPIRPRGFQIVQDQSFAIGGLVRMDFIGVGRASVVFYGSDQLAVHRGQIRNADALWQRHYGELLSPIAQVPSPEHWKSTTFQASEEKQDIVIPGVGWMAVSGQMKRITVFHPHSVDIIQRKAMI